MVSVLGKRLSTSVVLPHGEGKEESELTFSENLLCATNFIFINSLILITMQESSFQRLHLTNGEIEAQGSHSY